MKTPMNKPLRIINMSVNTNDIFITERHIVASLYFLENKALSDENNPSISSGFTYIIFSLKYVTS